MYSNKFSGTIPNKLKYKKNTFFDVGSNKLSGTLPDDMFFFDLRFLYLDRNEFTGTVPSTLPYGGNKRLEIVKLDHNSFTGEMSGGWELNKLRK